MEDSEIIGLYWRRSEEAVEAAAEKYGGAAAYERTGGRFRLDVLLNISGQRGGRSGQKT